MARPSSFINLEVSDLLESIKQCDRVMLGRAITLVESKKSEHQKKADALLNLMLEESSSSIRVAVSGAPGVGKSTFIESLGIHLVEQGHKVAVLSIDPSSDIHHGSILGDKTRMEKLSVHPNAFIRPSPAGDFLGGTAWRTREAITICETAGFDIILVETVGVGQSEYRVKEMVDCFLLLIAPGGGDELQGIKRGIVEIADVLAITKADGDLEEQAERTCKEYNQALHLFPQKENGWVARAFTVSSIEDQGIVEIWNKIVAFKNQMIENQFYEHNRISQKLIWFKERLAEGVQMMVHNMTSSHSQDEMKERLKKGTSSPISEANALLGKIEFGDK